MSLKTIRFVVKPLVFVASLGPVAWLVWAGLTGNLSANPLSDLTNETGVWALRFLCITLTITPLRRLTGWNAAIRFRRMAGLFAFFYGTLHFLTYTIADRFAGLDFPDGIVAWSTVKNLAASVGADIYKRPFITIGFTAFSLMVPLAVTSTAGMIRRLGGKRWSCAASPDLRVGDRRRACTTSGWSRLTSAARSSTPAIVAILLGVRVYWSRARATAPRPAARSGENLTTRALIAAVVSGFSRTSDRSSEARSPKPKPEARA